MEPIAAALTMAYNCSVVDLGAEHHRPFAHRYSTEHLDTRSTAGHTRMSADMCFDKSVAIAN